MNLNTGQPSTKEQIQAWDDSPKKSRDYYLRWVKFGKANQKRGNLRQQIEVWPGLSKEDKEKALKKLEEMGR